MAEALAALDATHLRDRRATELSGGELARVLIARLLAQRTPLILADEPVAGLDPAHQLAVMALFRLGSHIPTPGISYDLVQQCQRAASSSASRAAWMRSLRPLCSRKSR